MNGEKHKDVEKIEDSVARKEDKPKSKIALVPFVEADPLVHLLDATGKAFPARKRCAEDDFQVAVRNLGIQQTHAETDFTSRATGDTGNTTEKSEPDGLPNDSASRDKSEAISKGKETTAPEESKAEESKAEESKPGSNSSSRSDASGKASPAAAEHPLQKAITSFDMALGELNQLVHLVDLARAGEFMALERVTPSEEDQARGVPDQSARPGDGVPREALTTMVSIKRRQLKGAADELRQRAKRLRETTSVQQVFQQGLLHLRKSWRIVAPNHGKVNVPLQVGEALSVDCSFGSAGGKAVPFIAAAGTRHRHPWLFQLTCGAEGRLEVKPSKGQALKAFEIQLVSTTTGECEQSLRASFSGRCGESRWTGDARAGASKTSLERTGGEQMFGQDGKTHGGGAVGKPEMEALERRISHLQHSVFWEEVFDTIKTEALVDGKDGWMVHQDARCDSNARGDPKAFVMREGVTKIEVGAKRRSLSESSREPPRVTWDTGTRVVHVMDDEVMVEMNSQYLLGYRLVSGDAERDGLREKPSACDSLAMEDIPPRISRSEREEERSLASLCQLALLYCGSVIRQRQAQVQTAISVDRDKGKATPPLPADSAVGRASAGKKPASTSTWKAVGRVLVHHVARSKVVEGVASVSRSLDEIGLPFDVRWTHLETTFPASALGFTFGHCFHFRASVDGGSGVVVSALPGLHNHAEQRSVNLQSVEDLKQFLLGEVCRQVVLTFGDITAAWTTGIPEGGKCFRIDLAPAAIHLLPPPKARTSHVLCPPPWDKKANGWEVRVSVKEAGVQIACSKWSSTCSPSNGKAVKSDIQANLKVQPEAGHLDAQRSVTGSEVTVAEWDRLEGPHLFQKFSSLLASLYPL